MRGLLYIRLFFAFVPRSPQEGKRRFFRYGYGYFSVQNDAALCVEVLRASIGVPVHRLGNLCKTFFGVNEREFSVASEFPVCAGSANRALAAWSLRTRVL